MTEVENWAAGLCTAAIGLSVIMLLVPSGRMRKSISVLVGVCYFACLIAPLGEWCRVGSEWLDGKFPETTVSQKVCEMTDEQIDCVIEEALAEDARSRLSKHDVTVHSARIERDTSPQDGIYIRCVTLTVAGQFPTREVCTAMELAWGVEVEVVMADE